MLDPSTYDRTHRYYEQKRAEVLDGVSSGDSGHPRGPRGGHRAPGTECSARAHWPHARTWRQPIKVSFPYTSTRRPSQAIQGIKWDPRPSPRLTPWRKLNPGSKTSGGAESTAPTAGGPRKHTPRPEAPAAPAPYSPGPGTPCPGKTEARPSRTGTHPREKSPRYRLWKFPHEATRLTLDSPAGKTQGGGTSPTDPGAPLPSQGLPFKRTREQRVASVCLTLRNHVGGSLPGSSVHGILQTETLQWVAMTASRGSSQPRDGTQAPCVSSIGRRVLYH